MSRVCITNHRRKKVYGMFSGRCAYCGEQPKSLQVDHRVPVAQGGTNHIENLLPACAQCNNFKSTFSVEEFRSEILLQIDRARQRSINFRTAERFGMIKVKPVSRIRFYFEEATA
jgi:hypothetical protein